MQTFITEDFTRTLPRRDVQYFDTKLTGFALRCRRSGVHSFLMLVSRGRTVTLGRVRTTTAKAGLTVADARTAALTLKREADLAALAARAADPVLTLAKAKDQARAEIGAQRQVRADGALTLGAYVDDMYKPWVIEHKKTGAETIARLTATFADLLDTPLSRLSGFAIEKWRTRRLKDDDVTPATTNRDLAALRGALSRAVEWGKLTVSPLRTVKASKTDTIGHVRYLSEPEAARLLAALDARDDRRRAERARANAHRRARSYDVYPEFGRYTDHLAPLVQLALHTGLRRGELFALVWRDLDLTGARLTVRAGNAKGERARVVPLNDDALRVLRAWRPREAAPDALVFAGADGAPLQDIKKAWAGLMQAAKITQFRFHDLRHDFASRLVQSGVDLFTVSKLLGHSDTKMTTRYAHLSPAHMAAAVAKLVRA